MTMDLKEEKDFFSSAQDLYLHYLESADKPARKETVLLCAILNDAIELIESSKNISYRRYLNELLKRKVKRTTQLAQGHKKEIHEAYLWLTGKEASGLDGITDSYFSFDYVCEVLGLNKDQILDKTLSGYDPEYWKIP